MAIEYDVNELKRLIDSKDVKAIKEFMSKNELTIEENRIVPIDKNYFAEKVAYNDLAQYVKKIQLNSSYGALLNNASVFYDFRMGSSTTLSGRKVVQHLTAKANELLCGVYADKGYCAEYNDTDSQKYDSKQWVMENGEKKEITIEELFNKCSTFKKDDKTGKEYGYSDDIKVLSYNTKNNTVNFEHINFIYRHKSSKEQWSIKTKDNEIIVTDNHSCIVKRNNELIVLKPRDILMTDTVIEVKEDMMVKESNIVSCECVGNFNDEYVYDIGIRNNNSHTFFGNNILVHNSVYCYINNEYFKKAHPNFEFTKDNIIKFSDEVSEGINNSFPQHLMNIFHCNEERASLQRAAKEIVASRGLYVSKKRYAALVYEHDGFRQDTNGSAGEMKIMGLQVKRSDCPQLVRNLLKDMLQSLLQYGDKQKLNEILKEFGETKWKQLKPWEKGTPKACNKLTYYTQIYNETKKCSVGQVMASINWNILIDAFQDKKTPKILDGNKIIVCKLKPNNAYGMKSVAYPVDLQIFPDWFKSLPFDEQSMKDSVVDATIATIFDVLGWKLSLESAMNEVSDLDGFLNFDV